MPSIMPTITSSISGVKTLDTNTIPNTSSKAPAISQGSSSTLPKAEPPIITKLPEDERRNLSPNSSNSSQSDHLAQYDQDLENIYDDKYFPQGSDLDGSDLLGDDLNQDIFAQNDGTQNLVDPDNLDDDEEDFCINDTGDNCDEGDLLFDSIVGELEDIAVSSEFQKVMLNFCQEHCDKFDDDEENKLEYTDIFNQWTETIESFIENRLKLVVEDFSTSNFLQQLSDRGNALENEIMEEVLELLGIS